MGVYIRVEGDGTATWAGTSLGVTNGSGTDTWTYNDRFALPRASAYDVAQDIEDWHNASGRPWFGAATAAWAVGTTPATGRVTVTLTSTASTTWNGSADLLTLMDWSNQTATSIGTGTAGALGSVDVQLAVRNWIEHDRSPGVFCIADSWTNGTGQAATHRPAVSGFVTELEALALSDGLRLAANPRQAVVYELHGDAYRVIDLGTVDLTRGRDLYALTMTGLG